MRRSDKITRLAQQFPWPFRTLLRLSRERVLPFRIYDHWLSRKIADALHFAPYHEQWIRTVMYQECFKLVAALDPSKLDALEISPGPNHIWSRCGFKSIHYVDYPDFDICSDRLDRPFDLIIADQVFEHLLWPYRAGRNAYEMLNPGGHLLVTTPFLIRVHASGDVIPYDCSRWTPVGLKYFLAECGFPLEGIRSTAWGNRRAVVGNFEGWANQTWWRPMHNEQNFPVTVWALAKK